MRHWLTEKRHRGHNCLLPQRLVGASKLPSQLHVFYHLGDESMEAVAQWGLEFPPVRREEWKDQVKNKKELRSYFAPLCGNFSIEWKQKTGIPSPALGQNVSSTKIQVSRRVRECRAGFSSAATGLSRTGQHLGNRVSVYVRQSSTLKVQVPHCDLVKAKFLKLLLNKFFFFWWHFVFFFQEAASEGFSQHNSERD